MKICLLYVYLDFSLFRKIPWNKFCFNASAYETITSEGEGIKGTTTTLGYTQMLLHTSVVVNQKNAEHVATPLSLMAY